MTDAAELVTVTRLGVTFKASRRTVAHLDWTLSLLALAHPDARLRIIQPCYNTGVAASAGTHDFDAVFDVEIVGLPWLSAQTFLRKCGWAAWWRQPPRFSEHIHMVSLGYPGKVGIYVPGQVADYYAFRDGLASHAPDPTSHPKNIDATVFDYPAWLTAQEDDVTPEDIAAIAKASVEAFLETKIDTIAGDRKITVRQALRQAANANTVTRSELDDTEARILAAVKAKK